MVGCPTHLCSRPVRRHHARMPIGRTVSKVLLEGVQLDRLLSRRCSARASSRCSPPHCSRDVRPELAEVHRSDPSRRASGSRTSCPHSPGAPALPPARPRAAYLGRPPAGLPAGVPAAFLREGGVCRPAGWDDGPRGPLSAGPGCGLRRARLSGSAGVSGRGAAGLLLRPLLRGGTHGAPGLVAARASRRHPAAPWRRLRAAPLARARRRDASLGRSVHGGLGRGARRGPGKDAVPRQCAEGPGAVPRVDRSRAGRRSRA